MSTEANGKFAEVISSLAKDPKTLVIAVVGFFFCTVVFAINLLSAMKKKGGDANAGAFATWSWIS